MVVPYCPILSNSAPNGYRQEAKKALVSKTHGVTLTDDIVRAYDDLLTRKDSGVAMAEKAEVLAQTKLKNTPTPAQQEQLSKITSTLEEYENLFTPEEKAYDLRHNVVASVSGHDITDYDGKGPIEKGKNWVRDNISQPARTVIGNIYITPKTIRNTLNHRFGREKLNSIPAIIHVLENGKYLGWTGPENGDTFLNDRTPCWGRGGNRWEGK